MYNNVHSIYLSIYRPPLERTTLLAALYSSSAHRWSYFYLVRENRQITRPAQGGMSGRQCQSSTKSRLYLQLNPFTFKCFPRPWQTVGSSRLRQLYWQLYVARVERLVDSGTVLIRRWATHWSPPTSPRLSVAGDCPAITDTQDKRVFTSVCRKLYVKMGSTSNFFRLSFKNLS